MLLINYEFIIELRYSFNVNERYESLVSFFNYEFIIEWM